MDGLIVLPIRTTEERPDTNATRDESAVPGLVSTQHPKRAQMPPNDRTDPRLVVTFLTDDPAIFKSHDIPNFDADSS
jgi:hypothetical protein